MILRRSFIGVSVGSRQVACAEITRRRGLGRKGEWTVRSHRVEPIPAGTILPSPIERNVLKPEAYQKVCDLFLDERPSRSRLFLGLPDASVRLSLLDFEHLPKRKKDLEQLVRWQMEKVLLYPLKGARLAIQDLGKRAGGKRRLLAMAIRDEILAQYEAPFRRRGIEAISIGIASFHLFNLYHPYLFAASEPGRNFLFLSLIGQNFSVLICRGGVVDFVRVKELPAHSEAEGTEGETEAGSQVWDRIWGEVSTSLAFYQESGQPSGQQSENASGGASELTHLFISSDIPLSRADETVRNRFRMVPVFLTPEEADTLKFPSSDGGVSFPLLSAAAAVAGESD
jgi:hypothetical protein